MALFTFQNKIYNDKGELQYGGANAPSGTFVTGVSSLEEIPQMVQKYRSLGLDPSQENRTLMNQESVKRNQIGSQLASTGLRNIEDTDIDRVLTGENPQVVAQSKRINFQNKRPDENLEQWQRRISQQNAAPTPVAAAPVVPPVPLQTSSVVAPSKLTIDSLLANVKVQQDLGVNGTTIGKWLQGNASLLPKLAQLGYTEQDLINEAYAQTRTNKSAFSGDMTVMPRSQNTPAGQAQPTPAPTPTPQAPQAPTTIQTPTSDIPPQQPTSQVPDITQSEITPEQARAQGLIKIYDPEELKNYTEDQIVRTTGNEIFLKKGADEVTQYSDGSGIDKVTGEVIGKTGSSIAEQLNSLLKDYGLTPPDPTKNPVTEFSAMYKQLYTDLGIGSVKEQFEQVQKQYKDLQDELGDKIADTNMNPWLSEGLRSKQTQNLQSKYEGRLDALINQQKLYQSLYDQGLEEAKFVAQQGMTIAKQDQSFAQDAALKVMDLIQKQEEAKQKLLKEEKDITYSTQGVEGRTIRFGFDKNGKQVSRIDLGRANTEIGTGGVGGSRILSVNEAQALGVPYGTTETQAVAMGKTPKKTPTQAQETTALYANRLQQAEDVFTGIEQYLKNLSTTGQFLQDFSPNFLQSANYQSFVQAKRNFINATLRRESGAVISPTEFANGDKQYFPQPGDKPQVLAQKKANRELVTRGFIQGAGDAYIPSSIGNSQTQFTSPTGKSYQLPY